MQINESKLLVVFGYLLVLDVLEILLNSLIEYLESGGLILTQIAGRRTPHTIVDNVVVLLIVFGFF